MQNLINLPDNPIQAFSIVYHHRQNEVNSASWKAYSVHNSDSNFWLAAREKYILLNPQKANLNSGTLFPTPRPILDQAAELRQLTARDPSDFVWRQMPPLLQAARSGLARYLQCESKDLLLLPNVTFAINLLTATLKLPRGSEILTTDHEYGAMTIAWKRLADRDGLKLTQLKLPHLVEDPQEIVTAFSHAITPATRVLFFSHVATSTGLLMPADKLCTLAQQRGLISVVDGAHAPGTIPVDLTAIGADFYGANCHKWLMTPAGAGFLHVAPYRRALIGSIVTSWGFDYDPTCADQDSGNGGSYWQWDLEFHGTADRAAQMTLPAALGFRQAIGGDQAILKRMRSLSEHARQVIDLPCSIPRNPELSCGALISFDFPCDDEIEVRNRLWHEYNVECPITKAAGKKFLRVSTAWFNTEEEIDRLAVAVKRL